MNLHNNNPKLFKWNWCAAIIQVR